MKEITAAQAASYAQLPLFCGPEENRAVSAERDSRRTGEKSIFFALPGTKNDGNDFAPAAYETRLQNLCALPLKAWRSGCGQNTATHLSF